MNRRLIFAATLVLSLSTNVWADDDDDSYSNYDSIVADLKASAEIPDVKPVVEDMNWDDVAIHAGAGVATAFVHVTNPEGATMSGLMKGIEAHLGVNLFTRKVRAEGVFRTFAHDELSANAMADLKEFELGLVYTPQLQDRLLLRLGTGITARYLNVQSEGQSIRYTTPASFALLGVERKFTPTMSIGPDLAYRSAMISDTADKTSWNASLRLNATF